MRIKFLGTRGNIEVRTKKHYRHSTVLISYYHTTIMIDCGKDWLNKISQMNPDAIFITHAHPDHAQGLKKGSPAPVYATLASWEEIKNYKIHDRRIIMPEDPISIGNITIMAFEVEHSIHAPAVGYRIIAGKKSIFYVPDLVRIKKQKEALKNVAVYIGDGAIVSRSLLVREKKGTYVGHSPITEQLKSCKKEKIKKMIVTHCGTEIVTSDEDEIKKRLQKLSKEYDVEVQLAYDGLEIII
ncbi:MAG: MBL fold metallo-hydrolase [Candidatus Babeliales bacterium]